MSSVVLADDLVLRSRVKRHQVGLGDCTRSSIKSKLHFADFFIHFFHELDDEIDDFVLEHRFSVDIGDQKGDVISWHWFPTEDDETLRSLHHEASELVAQDVFDFIGLLDLDAHAYRVYGRFNQDPLTLVTRDRQWIEEDFLGTPCFHLWLVVPLDDL